MDIAFVILHYMTDEDTIACIDSITDKIDTDDYIVVVVDNASNNGSIERIEENTKENNHVRIVKNTENLGFARGLNSGIDVARQLGARFIACINNDVMLMSTNIVQVLEKKYKQYGFAILGPMMITGDNYCDVNPVRNTFRSLEECDQMLKKEERIVKIAEMHLIPVYNFFKRINNIRHKRIPKTLFLNDQVDYLLHGAFLIFSPVYFTVFDGFDSRTFLYGEESILYLHTLKNGLHTLYTPEIVIYHKEDSSTNKALPNSNERTKFIYKTGLDSVRLYKEIYLQYIKRESEG